MAAYKVGSWVNENCDSAEATLLLLAGLQLRHCPPLLQPCHWTSCLCLCIYAGVKLFQLGAKVVDAMSQPEVSGQTVNVTAR